MKTAFWTPLLRRALAGTIRREAAELARRETHAWLSAESEAAFTLGAQGAGESLSERSYGERSLTLEQALEAWRVNPLARRLVELTTQYTVGGGLTVTCRHAPTQRFVDELWRHPLNGMDARVMAWCDELTRSGNLFVLLSSDASGMSYLRAVPAGEIAEIRTRPNDVEQELAYQPRQSWQAGAPESDWPAYDALNDAPGADGRFAPVMLHYAINRPVGCLWGESDLAPLLRWLSRYANWLEDRARLNRFRTAFLYVVKARFASESERLARQQRLNAAPPGPGSILVSDESESWEVIAPQLESADANADGLALKKMIAAGAGVPLHFLAEPESSTRTTAEAAGGPTYRRFEQRQELFTWLLADVLTACVRRRAAAERQIYGRSRVQPRARIEVHGADLSARDNVALGMAGAQVMGVLAQLRDRQLIDDAELLRLVYRFVGETAEINDLLARGRQAGPPVSAAPAQPASSAAPGKVDLNNGELK